jgi:pyridoxine 5-phosphate synthase
VVEAAAHCENAGAGGITIHLREDRRHIQDADVYALRERLRVPMNLEMANSAEIVKIALDVKPDEVCLVPEKRQELTTEGGLDVAAQLASLRESVSAMRAAGIVVSMFIDPDPRQIEASLAVGATHIELHTGTYCDAAPDDATIELQRLKAGATLAAQAGLTVNAGHGINLDNLAGVLEIPHLDTLNIGHSIIAHAVFVGLENAVKAMLDAMQAYAGGAAS